MPTVGRVADIFRYPVKSMGGERLRTATIGPRGLPGDRGYALFDPDDRRVASAKQIERFPGLLDFKARYPAQVSANQQLPPVLMEFPDGQVLGSDHAECAAALSQWFNRPTGIAAVTDHEDGRPRAGKYAMANTFFDYAPLHLLTRTAVASLQSRAPGSVIAMERFRPNLVIEGLAGKDFPENDWTGCRLRLGEEVVLRVTDPCPRCALPTLAQGDLPRDPQLLKRIAHANTVHTPVLESEQPCLGAYAFVEQGGQVSVGDPVDLIAL